MSVWFAKKISHFPRSCLLTCLALPWQAYAEPSTGQYDFGRLFTSVEERRVLDSMRQRSLVTGRDLSDAAAGTRSVTSVLPEEKSQTDAVVFSGFMLRSDGQNRSWLGTPDSQSLPDKVKAGRPSNQSLSVPVQVENTLHRLKPGQTLLIEKKKVIESYQHQKDSAATSHQVQGE